jgi:acyl carrier protein
MLADIDNYRQRLVDLAVSEGLLSNTTVDEIRPDRSRGDLGLTSLNVILLIAGYLEQSSGDITFDPEWVASLETIGGIITVMQNIDALSAESVSVG